MGEVKSALGIATNRPRALWILIAAWSLTAFAIGSWWLQDRLRDHREQSAATAAVRLTGVKDTLSISFRQLAALPLELSHRRAIPALIAASQPEATAAQRTEV